MKQATHKSYYMKTVYGKDKYIIQNLIKQNRIYITLHHKTSAEDRYIAKTRKLKVSISITEYSLPDR